MGKDHARQLRLGGTQRQGDGQAVDKFAGPGADDLRAKQLARGGIEHRLHQAVRLAQNQRLAVAPQREPPHLYLMSRSNRRCLCQADGGDLRRSIDAGRDRAMRPGASACDGLDAADAVVQALRHSEPPLPR